MNSSLAGPPHHAPPPLIPYAGAKGPGLRRTIGPLRVIIDSCFRCSSSRFCCNRLRAPVTRQELMRDGAARAESFDLPGATDRFEKAARAGCEDGDAAAVYLRGLQAARDAYRLGGSPQSLEPVRRAESVLERHAIGGRAWAEIARVVLMAAAAAAQSERSDMETFLAHATALETARAAAGSPRVPGVTAHEAAGDLWLQVHRFDSARAAYLAAAQTIGMTPRIAIGLARAADRLKDPKAACDSYRTLMRLWDARAESSSEVAEARAYLKSAACP